MQLLTVTIILIISIILFISNKVRTDLVAMLALLALVLTGIINLSEAFAGFSNAIVIMVAGLFIIGAGIYRTGLAALAGQLLLKWSKSNEKRLFILLLIIVACTGAFMSNTGTVALMIPIVVSIAASMNSNPSKYLLPLSFIASMSGLLTLIASPTNLIISELLVNYDYAPLNFFSITPIGIIAVITVIIYLYAIRHRLLPDYTNKGHKGQLDTLSPHKLTNDYQLDGNLFHIFVPDNSSLIGRQLKDMQIPSKYDVFILLVERKGSDGIVPFPFTSQEMAGAHTVIQAKDILYVQGTAKQVDQLMDDYSLGEKTIIDNPNELVTKNVGIAEVILTPQSRLINETIKSVNFHEKYNVNILGLNHQRKSIQKNQADTSLQFGDTFLVQGTWENIELLAMETKDVVVIGQTNEHASMAAASGKAPIAGGILFIVILLMVLEIFPAAISVLIGAVSMVVTGCVRNMDDAYSQINWETIVLIAAMLPMATALEKTGGMELISNGIVDTLGIYGPIPVLAGIYLLTMIFGQFISNTATAVLFGPIAFYTATAMDANPYTFLITIAVAASMSFLTPVASPTNALVMSAGGYRFSDFLKIGAPLQIIMFFVMAASILFFFPL